MEDGTKNILDQIMQKFRPIAPKPITGGSVLSDGMTKKKRVKRKYVRVKKRKNNNNNVSLNDKNNNWLDLESMIDVCNGNELLTTDPLQKVSNWISFGLPKKSLFGKLNNSGLLDRSSSDLHGVDPTMTMTVQTKKMVESWITVESVTGTCDDRKLLGYSDDEVLKNLERDTCPGFTSNGYDEVVWVNQSYRKMLDLKSESDDQAEVAVWLLMKVEKSKMDRYLPALSCRVRIEYRLLEKKTQMVVPCDVCMMDHGGFAWRLDVESALSLGPMIS
ncbi:uncharacterized protein [Rutidosis leptorrhynchoides]|uniref:uncharacterized protein n=1 Tax=Rutidosis leptorrhynchoides TaxID=125765 RepID=UPI003A99090B